MSRELTHPSHRTGHAERGGVPARAARKKRRPASGPAAAPARRLDPRVLRSREKLGDALVALLLERPFDSIRVQDVLDRAGVGRSTFYAHFRDKNDLFLSDNEDFWESTSTVLSRQKDPSERVAPVREMLTHLLHWRGYYDALVRSGKLHDSFDLAQGHFARGIERRLCEMPRGRGIPPDRRRALAQALSGALVALMSWWIDRGAPERPEEIDALYHRLVWSGVGAERGPAALPAGRRPPVRP